MAETQSPVAAAVDSIFNYLQRIARGAILVSAVIALAALYLEDLLDEPHGKWEILFVSLLKFTSSILINALPVLVVFAFIRPFTERLLGTRLVELDQARQREHKAMLTEALAADTAIISNRLSALEGVVNRDTPISSFYPSFYAIPWKTVLDGAKRVELAAFYWSSDWLDENVPLFRAACEAGCEVNVFLPHPVTYHAEFTNLHDDQGKAKAHILETATAFLKNIDNHGNRATVSFVSNAINYMCARVDYGYRRIFIYSPFRNNTSGISGRPPVISIDESKCDSDLQSFIVSTQSLPIFIDHLH